MNIKSIPLFVLPLIVMLFAGCSSVSSTITPSSYDEQTSSGSLPVIGFNNSSAIGLFGAFNAVFSDDGASVDLVPMRNTAIGESYIVSGESFFTITPCSDCLKVSGIALNPDGNIILGLSIKHPFPKGDTLKPPSAMNRLDLDVFDIALMVKPLETSPDVYSLTSVDVYTGLVANADGYTTELSDVIDDSSAIPYKICYESENNNRFEMGTDWQSFDLVMSITETRTFDFYLTMGYGASATKSMRLVPEYYVPEFNRKSAWKVNVTPPEGNDPPAMGNTWNDSDTATEYEITIDIYDWNHGAQIAVDYPDSSNPDQIADSSDINSVTVEIPGMTSSIVNASTIDSVTNGWDDPITYTAMIANENSLPQGEYTGLVKVIDSRIPGDSITGGETDTLAHSVNGILLEWHEIPEFATYQTFVATVVEGNTEPVCDIQIDDDEGNVGDIVYADPGTSYDPDGFLISYEYDPNYDGIDFDAEIVQNSGDPDFGDPVPIVLCHSSDVTEVISVAIRITDDGMNSVICSVDATVHPSPKNVVIRSGATDFGVREETGEGWVGFSDGQIWIYNQDYSSGTYELTPPGGTAIKFLDVTARGDLYSVTQNRIFFRYSADPSVFFDIGYWSNDTFDVAEIDYQWGSYPYYYDNGGMCMRLRIDVSPHRQLYGRHTWILPYQLSYYPPNQDIQDREGATNMYYCKGIENARTVNHLWVLEGAPRYEAERMSIEGVYTGVTIGLDGGQSDEIDGFNDPKDITTDIYDNVYILDLLSTGQPVIKKYRDDGTPVGMFGDTTSISGTPMRMDADESDGSIHVLHTNGFSIFTECEIPD